MKPIRKVLSLSPKRLLDTLFELFESLASAVPYLLDETLAFLVAKTAKAMNADSCTLRLFDNATGTLILRATYGLSNSYKDKPALKVGEGIAGLVFAENRLLSVPDIHKEPRYTYRYYAEREGVRSLICAPLSLGGNVLGTWSVYFKRPHAFTREEEEFFTILTNYVNAIMEIMELQKDMHSRYMETIRLLVTALEAKDEFTSGHSERVAEYCVKIGKELGLPKEQLTMLYDAGILHDIGKLVVDTHILNKPHLLEEKEWKVIKQHPITGERILRPVRIFEPFLLPVRHHHERVDGKGYPDGLSSSELSLVAKVIAVADAYDAMTSPRPYREPFTHEVAVRELRIGSGSQFDPEIVEAFIRVLSRERDDNPK